MGRFLFIAHREHPLLDGERLIVLLGNHRFVLLGLLLFYSLSKHTLRPAFGLFALLMSLMGCLAYRLECALEKT